MRSLLTAICLGSLLFFAITCTYPTETKHNKASHNKILDTCNLNDGNGQRVASRLGCMNCHLFGDSHMSLDLKSPAIGKNQVLNLDDLCRVDSMRIINYVIKQKHHQIYKNDPSVEKLTNCDISNLIYYLHSCNRMRY